MTAEKAKDMAAAIMAVCDDGYNDREEVRQAMQGLVDDLRDIGGDSYIAGAIKSMIAMIEDMQQ